MSPTPLNTPEPAADPIAWAAKSLAALGQACRVAQENENIASPCSPSRRRVHAQSPAQSRPEHVPGVDSPGTLKSKGKRAAEGRGFMTQEPSGIMSTQRAALMQSCGQATRGDL